MPRPRRFCKEAAEGASPSTNLAPSGREDTGDHVHQRRLSRPVWAEDAHDLAFGDSECHVVDGYKTAKAFGHMIDSSMFAKPPQ